MKYATLTKSDEKCIEIEKIIKEKIKLEYDLKEPDIVITIGGDGTTLSAIRQYVDRLDKTYIVSLNAGHLGFFSSFDDNEIDDLVEYVNSFNYSYDELGLIKYDITTLNNENIYGYAINEVTLVNPRRTLVLDVYLNSNYFEHYRGTGMCISTPVGSTGYNKSLHGAVLLPNLEVFQLTEIASINSNLYHTLQSPLILGKNDIIELTSETTKELWITADSISLSFKDFKSIKISLSDKKAKLVNRNIKYIDRIKKNFII